MKRVSRRGLLQIGSLAGLGINFAGVLAADRARAAELPRSSAKPTLKSCIVIFCNGGPSHLDTAAEIFDQTGRPFRLAEGTPVAGLFAGTA